MGAKKASLWALTHPANPSTPSIDENSLLTEEDLKRRGTIQRPDCDVKRTRKACKNCSCGLKEMLLQEQDDIPSSKTTQTANNVEGKNIVSTGAATSSCGNCYLGDAFRCASCPYLGMFSFSPPWVKEAHGCQDYPHLSQGKKLNWVILATIFKARPCHVGPLFSKVFRFANPAMTSGYCHYDSRAFAIS